MTTRENACPRVPDFKYRPVLDSTCQGNVSIFMNGLQNCDGSARNASVVQYFIRLSAEEASSHAAPSKTVLASQRNIRNPFYKEGKQA